MKSLVNSLVLKFQTRDPFEIASNLGIVVLEEPLGSINGYYNKILDVQFIHVNCELSECQKRFVVAHELGHALLHPDFNFFFLNNETFFDIGKFEKEADQFAILLIVDKNAHDFQTVDELSAYYGFNEKIKNYLYDWGGKYGIC